MQKCAESQANSLLETSKPRCDGRLILGKSTEKPCAGEKLNQRLKSKVKTEINQDCTNQKKWQKQNNYKKPFCPSRRGRKRRIAESCDLHITTSQIPIASKQDYGQY